MRHHDQESLAISRITLRCLKTGLFRDGVQFCSGLVNLVVCVRRHGGGGHHFALLGEGFVGRLAEASRRWVIAVVISRTPSAARGLRAKPAMVAAGS